MAYEKQIGTYHLADNPQLYEIQRNNTYQFVVTGLDNIRVAGANATDKDSVIKNAEQVLRLSVNEAAIPHYTQQPVEVKRGNSTLKYAGVPSFDAGQFKFHDFIGARTKDVLMAWQNLSYDVRTEKVGSLDVTNYKKIAYLIEYTPDMRPVRVWKYYGCWISGISEGSYSNENGDKHLIDATIQYDHAEVELGNPLTDLGPTYRA